MRLSEYIKKLQAAQAAAGDVKIFFRNDDDNYLWSIYEPQVESVSAWAKKNHYLLRKSDTEVGEVVCWL